MKKLVIITALLLTPVLTFGQGVFDKFEEIDEVSSFVINQKRNSLLPQFGLINIHSQ